MGEAIMKFAGYHKDTNIERIDKQVEEEISKMQQDNPELPQEQIDELKALLYKQFEEKLLLFSCPKCGHQDGELESAYLCLDCLESAAIIQGKFKEEFLIGNADIGDFIYRTSRGWQVEEKDEDLIIEKAAIQDIAESFMIDVIDLSIKFEEDFGNWIVTAYEKAKALQEEYGVEEQQRKILLIEWSKGDMYLLKCNNCDSTNLTPLNFICCNKCDNIYIPCCAEVVPLRDNKEENRATPCYMILSQKGDAIVVSQYNEKKNHLIGINTFEICGPDEIDIEFNPSVCSYSLMEDENE